MIRRLIDLSLDNRLAVCIAWLLVVIAGWFSMQALPIDAVPDVTNVQVQVLSNAPGLAPEEVESLITFPVEAAMNGIPRVDEIRSVSKFGLSVVTVVFEEGTDIYWARQLVSERLVEAREGIPEGLGDPEMGPISTGLGEIYQFEVRGEDHSPMELRTLLDWTINYQLRSVPGVVEVNSFGGELKTYQITLDPDRLVAFGVPLKQVFEAVRGNNRNVGGGYIVHADEQFVIRGEGLIETLDDLGDVLITENAEGTPVYLRQLGRVEEAPLIRQGAVTRDGRGEAVVGIVMMLMGENSREVARAVDERITEIRRNLPDGVTIDTFYDRTELVDRTIATVTRNLLEGGILVVVVLLLLLGNLRAGLLVAASIPLSMLVAFTAMRWAGISGNLMSLGAVDFGLIVDGSVVMIENIVRHVRKHGDNGEPHLERVRRACHEVARPVVFAVAIITLVYLPILVLRGVEGRMFRPMALTVVFALAGSLVCALTLMPVMASLLLRRVGHKEPWLAKWAHRAYVPILAAVQRRPGRAAGIAGVVFVISLALTPFLGAEFVPRLDEGAIAMQIWRLPSVSLETSNEISGRVERVIREFPEVETIISRTGRAEIATDPMGVEISDTYLMLAPRKAWRFETKDELIAALDERLAESVPGVMFSYSQPIELRMAELLSGVRSDVGIKIFAPSGSLDDIERVAADVAEVVGRVPGMEEVKAEQVAGLPSLRIRLDRERLARLGIHGEDVLDVIETIGGKPLGNVMEGQRRFVLQARFDPEVRESPDALRRLRVSAPGGAGDQSRMVPLSQVAEISLSEGPAQISRERTSRRTTVEANVRGRDLASAVADAQVAVEREVDLPSGWFIEWGGQFQNLREASRRLMVLVPLGLMLIFALLYGAFGRVRLAALVFLNVPLAATGGVLMLWLRGYPFSISAAVGFIALFGIAVMNGVVLISCVRQCEEQGKTVDEAASEGATLRLRPVLMTALTDAIGFLPMAIAMSAGAEVQRPLATVVIGGIITSTMLTLFILPAIYPRVMRWQQRRDASPAAA